MNTVKVFYTKYIKPWVKALGSAVGGAIAGLLINIVKGEAAWPQSQQEWLTVLVAAVLPAIVTVFSPTNKITQKQLDKDPNVVGGTVIDATAPSPPPSADRWAPTPWRGNNS